MVVMIEMKMAFNKIVKIVLKDALVEKLTTTSTFRRTILCTITIVKI